MATALTIVAHIEAQADKVELVKSELLKLIVPTRSEPGCLQYDLHQDNEKPAIFKFLECWENRDLWQTHMNSPHLAAFSAATEGAILDFVVNEMTQVG